MKWEMQLIGQDSNYIFKMLQKLVIVQCTGYIEGCKSFLSKETCIT